MQYISIGNLGRPWSLRYKLKKNTLRFISEDDLKKSAMKKVLSLMNPPHSYLKVGDKKEYAEFINGWIWQWFAHLTFPDYPRFKERRVKKILKDWTDKLCTEERIQVGYFYSLVFKHGHPHLHLLMLGRSRSGKTLGNVDRTVWERKWPYRAKIEIPESNAKVSYYLDKNLSEWNSDLDIYNVKLLKKVREQTVYNPVGPTHGNRNKSRKLDLEN